MSQRPGPKPTPKKPLPKPPPKPQPKPPQRPIPDIPRPSPLPKPIPNPRNPRGPIDMPPYDRSPGPIPQIPRPSPLPSGEIPIPIEAIGSPENKIIRYLPDGTPVTADQGVVVGLGNVKQQMYNDMLARAITQQQAISGFIPTPVQPTPVAQASTQQTTPTTPVPQVKQNQQAMQNYTNLLNQGLVNYQAQTGQPTFGQPKQQTQRKLSTPSFQTPRPF